jgi:hypothetical protein
LDQGYGDLERIRKSWRSKTIVHIHVPAGILRGNVTASPGVGPRLHGFRSGTHGGLAPRYVRALAIPRVNKGNEKGRTHDRQKGPGQRHRRKFKIAPDFPFEAEKMTKEVQLQNMPVCHRHF